MLVKRKPTSWLSLEISESCSTIYSAKINVSFTMYLLLVEVFKLGTRIRHFLKFADFLVGVSIEDNIVRNGEYLCEIY